MTLPAYNKQLHDIGVGGNGFIRDPSVNLVIQDAEPATARAAQGEGRYDSYQDDSYMAQADWSGGIGQARLTQGDASLSSIAVTNYPGLAMPAKKVLTEANGGTAYWMFERNFVLYGLLANAIQTIGTVTSQAITSATPLCQPVVSAALNVFWATNEAGTKKLYKWGGSGAPVDVTPPATSPTLVVPYNRFLWSFGARTLKATSGIRQSGVSAATATNHVVQITGAKPGNTIVFIGRMKDATTTWTLPTGVQTAADNADATNGMQIHAWYAESIAGGNLSYTFKKNAANNSDIEWLELEGLTFTNTLDQATTGANTVSGTTGRLSGTLSNTPAQADFLIAAWIGSASTAGWSGYTNSFTEQRDQAILSNNARAATAYKSEAIDTSTTATASVTSVTDAVMLAFMGNAITSDLTQTAINYTTDDGTAWKEAYQEDSAGLPTPLAAVAAEDFLWITTAFGLYRMAVDEEALENGETRVVVAISGPVDHWDSPFDSGSAGTFIAVSQRVQYYNVGGTIRQFAPNGDGRQLWPPDDWATVTAKVQALASGEGGVYWSAGGYLYNYNGRGFHVLAKEASAGQFDYLKWFAGKLYGKGSPAPYLNFQYPSTRPDLVFTTPESFDVGYIVSSLIDNEKASIDKVLRHFQLQAYFTAGATAGETGNVALHYYIGNADPGKQGGGATSLTWTSIGSLSGADTTFYKDFTLGTPLVSKRFWLRVTLTPGTLGYPVLMAVIADGRALMPDLKRVFAGVQMSTATRDRTGARMYDLPADVAAAYAALNALRPGTYTTVNVTDGPNHQTDYVCTSDQFQHTINGFWHDNTISVLSQVNFKELPRP